MSIGACRGDQIIIVFRIFVWWVSCYFIFVDIPNHSWFCFLSIFFFIATLICLKLIVYLFCLSSIVTIKRRTVVTIIICILCFLFLLVKNSPACVRNRGNMNRGIFFNLIWRFRLFPRRNLARLFLSITKNIKVFFLIFEFQNCQLIFRF